MRHGPFRATERSIHEPVEPSDGAMWTAILLVAAAFAFSRVIAVLLDGAALGAEPTLALLCSLSFALAAAQATFTR